MASVGVRSHPPATYLDIVDTLDTYIYTSLHHHHQHTPLAEDAGLAARGPDGAAGAVIARGGGAGAGLHRPRALAHDGQVLGPPLAPRLRGRRGPQARAAAPRAAQPVR